MNVLAFYLPQFHPIPENDTWWGAGFTEWTNVTKSRPRFPGHYQPHLPADLGFYDLRLAQSRIAQAELARRYGINGFCYYHYWFNGTRLLGQPLDDLLASGEPDFPFCLCWANESWTRNWSGENKMVLQGQAHSAEDDDVHIRWLLKVFADRRYIKVDGQPLIVIYRSDLLPDAGATVERWRAAARAAGWPGLHVLGVLNNFAKVDEAVMLDRYGFDGVIEFQPSNRHLPNGSYANRIANKLRKLANAALVRLGADPAKPTFTVTSVHSYAGLANNAIAALKGPRPPRVFPTVIPSWDNSPRRTDGARVVQNTDPAPYEAWLREAIRSAGRSPGESFVFINAWNEWAEGCHLEPDREVGHGFLEATARAIGVASPQAAAARAPTATGSVRPVTE
jgi:lipopolysaccharide biosynthesis protein